MKAEQAPLIAIAGQVANRFVGALHGADEVGRGIEQRGQATQRQLRIGRKTRAGERIPLGKLGEGRWESPGTWQRGRRCRGTHRAPSCRTAVRPAPASAPEPWPRRNGLAARRRSSGCCARARARTGPAAGSAPEGRRARADGCCRAPCGRCSMQRCNKSAGKTKTLQEGSKRTHLEAA